MSAEAGPKETLFSQRPPYFLKVTTSVSFLFLPAASHRVACRVPSVK